MTSLSNSQNQPREARKLSCRHCQRRKKRCNKQMPCSNCIKNNLPCQPSTPAPPRKRRQPAKELLARLAWCEEQLRLSQHCQCCSHNNHRESSMESSPLSGAADCKSESSSQEPAASTARKTKTTTTTLSSRQTATTAQDNSSSPISDATSVT